MPSCVLVSDELNGASIASSSTVSPGEETAQMAIQTLYTRLRRVSEAREYLAGASTQYLQCLKGANRSEYRSGSVQTLLSLARLSLEQQP